MKKYVFIIALLVTSATFALDLQYYVGFWKSGDMFNAPVIPPTAMVTIKDPAGTDCVYPFPTTPLSVYVGVNKDPGWRLQLTMWIARYATEQYFLDDIAITEKCIDDFHAQSEKKKQEAVEAKKKASEQRIAELAKACPAPTVVTPITTAQVTLSAAEQKQVAKFVKTFQKMKGWKQVLESLVRVLQEVIKQL